MATPYKGDATLNFTFPPSRRSLNTYKKNPENYYVGDRFQNSPRVPNLFSAPFRKTSKPNDEVANATNLQESAEPAPSTSNCCSGSNGQSDQTPNRTYRDNEGQGERQRQSGSDVTKRYRDLPFSSSVVQIRTNTMQFISWTDDLRTQITEQPHFSKKVFLGGIPDTMSQHDIANALAPYGLEYLDWPMNNEGHPMKYIGYVYVVFRNANQVRHLLQSCTLKDSIGRWRLRVNYWSTKVMQVIPWDMNNNYYSKDNCATVFNKYYLIFVGGLHGKMTAKNLFNVMGKLFSDVLFVSLEVDGFGYPIGTAQVAFSSRFTYLEALKARYISIQGNSMERVLQIEPYLSNSQPCSECQVVCGPFLCRNVSCLKYICMPCFGKIHKKKSIMKELHLHQMMFKAPYRIQKKVSDATLSEIYSQVVRDR